MTYTNRWIALAIFLLMPIAADAQESTSDRLFSPAIVTTQRVKALDQAREIKLMDATPDGSLWYVVNAFAGWQTIMINGDLIPGQFHEISSTGTKLSPNGDYVIWSGLLRGFTTKGYDSTVTNLYKGSEFIGSYVSDYPALEFSLSGKRWAALLPYAYQEQKGDRDFVIVDGTVAHKNEDAPHLFAFSHDETEWAYRSTVNREEKLITSAGSSQVLYKRAEIADGSTWNPTIWRFTPDVSYIHKALEGRDYDLHFANVARINRTAYSSRAADTARTYVSFHGKNQGLFRWIVNMVIDTAGKHIAYFACDPAITKPNATTDEQRGVVVYDGQIVGGPYPGVSRLFLSPSGKHYAYGLAKQAQEFYLDKKLVAKTAQILDCVWSPDEKKIAYLVVGEHDKVYVVSGGKRSPLYENVGRIGWTSDGRYVQFVGVSNGEVYKIKQSP